MTGRMTMEPEVRAGDFVVVGKPFGGGDFLGSAISAVEETDAVGDSKFVHSFVVASAAGTIIDTLMRVQYGKLSDYANCPMLIGRYRRADKENIARALSSIKSDLGKLYPAWRLVLDFFHLGRMVHSDGIVCSERTAKHLWYLTGIASFRNWFGWTPSDIADVIENWRQFDIVFERKRITRRRDPGVIG
jgi:hypothetical protein